MSVLVAAASAAATVRVSVGGLSAPAAAAALGYTSLTFQDEFDSLSTIDVNDTRAPGFNWYVRHPFGIPETGPEDLVISNSILTYTGPSEGGYVIGSTASTTVGQSIAGGAYFEASMRFDPVIPVAGWPTFWSMQTEHFWGGDNSGWIECDFMDKFFEDETRYLSGGHWWTFPGGVPSNQPAVDTVTVPGGFDFRDFHTYGFAWVPGVRWQHYLDNVSQGTLLYSNNTFLANGDDQNWTLILGGDNQDVDVDWVRVWQAP